MQFHSLRLLRILSKYIYQVNQSFHKHNYPHGPQIQQSTANNEVISLSKISELLYRISFLSREIVSVLNLFLCHHKHGIFCGRFRDTDDKFLIHDFPVNLFHLLYQIHGNDDTYADPFHDNRNNA